MKNLNDRKYSRERNYYNLLSNVLYYNSIDTTDELLANAQPKIASDKFGKIEVVNGAESRPKTTGKSAPDPIMTHTSKNPPPYIFIDRVAEITGYKKSWIYRLTSEMKIPHIKNGNKLWFKESEIIEWIEKGRKVRTQTDDEVDKSLRLIGKRRGYN